MAGVLDAVLAGHRAEAAAAVPGGVDVDTVALRCGADAEAARTVAAQGVGGYALLAAGLAIAGIVPSAIGYTVSTVVVALGDALLLGYAYTLVARLAPKGAKAAYFSVYGLTWGLALTVGPPLMGLMLDQGVRTFWLAAAGAMFATGVAHRLSARALSPTPIPTPTPAIVG